MDSADGWDDGCVDFVLGLKLPESDESSAYMREYRAAQSVMEWRRENAGEVRA